MESENVIVWENRVELARRIRYFLSAMSKTEILAELPKLTAEERCEVLAKLLALDDTEWLDEGELTDDEKRIIIERLDACDRDPNGFVPWAEAEARLKARFPKVRAKK